ncbi:penicillin-binding protein [Streptomyces sp. PKU-MA01144]|uniref:penicillin-binding transpeptidase domain-containing protein n=1 Tax=Streptomyces sp. PKU-MA01144 TaxID=2729138 RepID=UPI0014807841|nr:penicillin-binding transpeptidase domain-containing protein [Streptomyces sp. PKU-MA01144]NNJ03419.1 penicillin-binding protein [Streptomyces sp. PKU-MA01144]
MRSGAKIAVVGGVFVLFAGGVGYGAHSALGGGDDGGTESKSGAVTKRSGPPSAEEIRTTAKDFLAAWASGQAPRAAQLTNDAAEAEPLLSSFRDGAHVSGVTMKQGKPVGPKVPFTVSATVSYEGASKPWTYASELTVVRGLTTGRPLVDWAPSVVHPQLGEGARLKTGPTAAPPIKAVDRRGRELTKEKYPSLGPVLDQLRQRYGDKAGGKPGVELVISPADGADGADSTVLTLAEGEPGEVVTTLDADVQAAAEQAVKRHSEASVVAIRPSTGEIRAVANNRADGFNAALGGQQAPGSTMKIVTAALLLDKGLVAADRKVECPKNVMYQGRTFHNLDHFDIPDGTFTQSFARSCNTAFIKQIRKVGDDAALSRLARDTFGIGLEWSTGVPTFDGSVPEGAGGEAAAQYIGQGTIQMNALTVASIAATAKNGGFRQPVVVPRSLDGRELATANRPLSGSVWGQLRDMMRATAQWGSGAEAMAGVPGDKGAKTGSAEVDGQATSNSWFAGFAGDLAAAAVVQAGGHGGDAAGPLVASVLKSG